MPETLASSAAVRALFALFEHHVVALQAERIARYFQRDVVAAAELQSSQGVEHAPVQRRRELDFAAGENVGGSGEDAARAKMLPCGVRTPTPLP